MRTVLQCCIEIVSPVHVGCDEVYEPTGFVVDERNGHLVVLDPAAFFADMDEKSRNRFAEICRKGTVSSLLEIYKFLRGRPATGKPVSLCGGFLDHYAKTLELGLGDERRIRQELNNFTIARTAFLSHDNRPYIPGSAVKGAIRTAYLNARAKAKTLQTPKSRGGNKDLEKNLLDGGSFDTDPFRMLKVSDFTPIGEPRTKIEYAVNEKKKLSSFAAHGPYQILEVIEPGACFQGSLTLDQPLNGAGIRAPLDMDVLIKSIGAFYSGEKSREDQELARIGIEATQISPNNGLGLLRLGRHSGAESVTIEGHRNIRIMQGKGQGSKTLDRATTLWLAAEHREPSNKGSLKPFGWALLKSLTPDLLRELEEREARRQSDTVQVRAHGVTATGRATGTAPAAEPKQVVTEVWDSATLSWNPSRSELEVSCGSKKSGTRAKELVPESLHNKLFKKKKMVTGRVVVEVVGPRYFKIVKIETVE